MLLVSVHVVTFNNATTIRPVLESVFAQEGVEFEILLIDNASHDDTVDIVQSLGVSLIQNEKNIGYAAAHNLALANTQSVYVLTLNPDVLLQAGFLQALVQVMENHPRLGSAAGCLLRVDKLNDFPHSVDSTGLFMMPSRRQRLHSEGMPVEKCPREMTLIFGPDGAAAFYRRAMLEDIAIKGEVFDEDFFLHKEDVDICWRAHWRGWQSVYVPAAVAHHMRTFRPGHRKKVSSEIRCRAVRNRYLVMLKNDAPALFWRDFLNIAAYELRILAYLLLFERRSLPAYVGVWKHCRRMLEKRHVIQTQRRVSIAEIRRWLNPTSQHLYIDKREKTWYG